MFFKIVAAPQELVMGNIWGTATKSIEKTVAMPKSEQEAEWRAEAE
jgi:hypothetical protein